jgi:hypothetical protein
MSNKTWVVYLVRCYDKIFKNQRPPAELAPASSRGHPHTPSSAGGR